MMNKKMENQNNIQEEENKASIEIASIINFGNLKENDVVVFRINKLTVGLLQALKTLDSRYGKDLKDKNVTIMCLGPGDSIETVDEKQMGLYGWEKKNKNRIITLDQL